MGVVALVCPPRHKHDVGCDSQTGSEVRTVDGRAGGAEGEAATF